MKLGHIKQVIWKILNADEKSCTLIYCCGLSCFNETLDVNKNFVIKSTMRIA